MGREEKEFALNSGLPTLIRCGNRRATLSTYVDKSRGNTVALDETTSRILQLQAGAQREYFQAALLLVRIRANKEYKPKYKTFNAYVKGDLKPKGMSRAWVYELMILGTCFTEQEAVDYGIAVLYFVYQIRQAIFPTVEPEALLSGTHSFKDADGEDEVLDFQNDHSEETLKAILASHHSQPPPAVLRSQEGPAIDKVLKREKATLDTFAYRVAERSHNGSIRVLVTMDALDGAYRDLFSDLSDGV